jgi:hypothetical protein
MALQSRASIVREISVRCQVSGKALAAGITANRSDQEPAASAVPLTYYSNDAKKNEELGSGEPCYEDPLVIGELDP